MAVRLVRMPWLGLLLLAAQVVAAQPLTVYYNERPPYAVTQPDGQVHGLTATPAAQALRSAGIEFRWTALPATRQIATIRDGREPACALGWFRNPGREAFARFSKPLYQDRPTVALAAAGSAFAGRRLSEVLATPALVVLVKDHFSYGSYVDALLARIKPIVMSTTVENVQMVQMIARGRADLMFTAEEEAASLLDQAGPEVRHLQVLRFPDMPPGERRHLMCSRAVPAQLMQRLDEALHE